MRTVAQIPADILARILDATIVVQHAGEMNNKITVAVIPGTALCTTTSSFFVFRWLSILWITNGCSLDTSLCLTLWTACAAQIVFPADLSILTITPTTVLLTGFYCKKLFKYLCPGHRLVLLCRVFSCPGGKACLALFHKDGVIVTRCRLFGSGHPAKIHYANASD
jgi:hypothetical protein